MRLCDTSHSIYLNSQSFGSSHVPTPEISQPTCILTRPNMKYRSLITKSLCRHIVEGTVSFALLLVIEPTWC